MDPASISAIAALAGSAIGGLTSLTAQLLTQQVQFSAQRRSANLEKRQDVYKSFIEEGSRLYADAFENSRATVTELVKLYALVNRMRVMSSPEIVDAADGVVRKILETYLAPNRTLRDVTDLLDDPSINPLREFSEACREELRLGER